MSGTERPGIAAAVVVRGGRVLMIRRRVAEGELLWQFPAGAIEPGETARQAAERETLEETGLKVAAREVLGSRVHPQTGRLMTYVACAAVDGGKAWAADPDEVDAVEWLSLPRVPARVPHGVFGPVQEYLEAEIPAQLAAGGRA